jgi:hypothetical protein
MELKKTFLLILNIILIAILIFYFINPGVKVEFNQKNLNYNFTTENSSTKIQFYKDMRFPEKTISYKIEENCNNEKSKRMKEAFSHLTNKTILTFYPVKINEEITINCKEEVTVENDLFLAGEGGPTSIINGTKYKIILHGDILLIRDSECKTPNVEIHELLHVLGFNHSKNENNIMYPISKCKQTIGNEIIETINKIYNFSSLPDLIFEKISANQDGRNLNINLSIRNAGLKKSQESKIIIHSNEEPIKEISLKPLELGFGIKIELKNIWLKKTKVEELTVTIKNDFKEISKENNKIVLLKSINP